MTETKYQRQKNTVCARLRVQTTDLRKINKATFTLFDFLDACFSFSPSSKKQAAIILQELKTGPKSFAFLLSATGASKSSLFLLLEALKKSGLVEVRGATGGGAFAGSGLVENGGRDAGARSQTRTFALSNGFSDTVSAYAFWWGVWKERF